VTCEPPITRRLIIAAKTWEELSRAMSRCPSRGCCLGRRCGHWHRPRMLRTSRLASFLHRNWSARWSTVSRRSHFADFERVRQRTVVSTKESVVWRKERVNDKGAYSSSRGRALAEAAMPGRGLTLRLIATIADYEIGHALDLSRRFGCNASYHSQPIQLRDLTFPSGVTRHA